MELFLLAIAVSIFIGWLCGPEEERHPLMKDGYDYPYFYSRPPGKNPYFYISPNGGYGTDIELMVADDPSGFKAKLEEYERLREFIQDEPAK